MRLFLLWSNLGCSSSTTNPVSVSRVDSSFLVFSLSSYRYSYISRLFYHSLHWFIINKQQCNVLCSLFSSARSIGYRKLNPQPLTESVTRLMYLRVYDNRDKSRSLHPPRPLFYSLTHTQITLPTPTILTITFTQLLWFLDRLVRSTVSYYLTTRTRLFHVQQSVCETF